MAFLDYLRDSLQLPGQYADRDLKSTRHPAKIDIAMQRRFVNLLDGVRNVSRSKAAIRQFTGCYLTEPKTHVVFETPEMPLSSDAFGKLAMRHGLELDLKTRVLYDDEHVFINGEAKTAIGGVRAILRELADRRSLTASGIAKFESGPTLAFLYQCYCDGVLAIGRH